MTNTSIIQHRDISVEIIRSSRRKTMALQIKNGNVSIRIPKRLARHYAETFIAAKYSWIKTKLEERVVAYERTLDDGETILFLGQALTLKTVSGTQNQVVQRNDVLQVETKNFPIDRQQKQKQLEKWMRQHALTYLLSRCEELSQQCRLQPKKVTVRSYKSRWGSCNIRGEIQLNWKLIMAPAAVIDYVIIHELCHLQQHNHSPAFWQLVEQFEPNFKAYRLWLKQHGYGLIL